MGVLPLERDGRLDFTQHAIFPSKLDFERYWYSERSPRRAPSSPGYYQVPLLPTFHEIVGSGATVGAPGAS